MKDIFNIPMEVGETVAIFYQGEANTYSGISEVSYYLGTIISAEELPSGKFHVMVKQNDYSEEIRREYTKEDLPNIDSKSIKKYFADSLFGYKTLREVIPEYFL